MQPINKTQFEMDSTKLESLILYHWAVDTPQAILKRFKEGEDIVYYKEGVFSVYLAKYEGTLMWTLNHHINHDEWENICVEAYPANKDKVWTPFPIQAKATLDNLVKYYKTTMPNKFKWCEQQISKNNYQGD